MRAPTVVISYFAQNDRQKDAVCRVGVSGERFADRGGKDECKRLLVKGGGDKRGEGAGGGRAMGRVLVLVRGLWGTMWPALLWRWLFFVASVAGLAATGYADQYVNGG